MSARWWTLVVWALVAASALAWGFRIFVRSPPAPPQTRVAGNDAPVLGDLTRLLGADAPPPVAQAAPEPAADARFKLIGVVNPRSPQAAREGVALIAVDGKPARAYRIGAVVDGANVLQGVDARGASLGPARGPAAIALRLPPPTPAATAALPSALAPVLPRAAPAPGVTNTVPPAVAPPANPLMPQRPPGAPMTPMRVLPSATADDGGDGEEAPAAPVGGRPSMR